MAYLKPDGAAARIVRSVAGLDAPTAEKVAARARARARARANTGRLTGAAAGEEMERKRQQIELLTDLREAVTTPAVHLDDLLALLARHRPGVYGHLDATALGVMLHSLGIVPATVWDASKPRDKASGKGIQRDWLDRISATAHIGAEAEERRLRSVSS